MSTTDNWLKLRRWWQEHLKSHFTTSPTSTHDHRQLHRRQSLVSFRSMSSGPLSAIRKRASYHNGVDKPKLGFNDFRHVRDDVRDTTLHKKPMTSKIESQERNPTPKASADNRSSDETVPNQKNCASPQSKTMNKRRNCRSRRFSLARFDVAPVESNAVKDESKSAAQATGLNLIQKFLFRQINPKTRPCSNTISSNNNAPLERAQSESMTDTQHATPSPSNVSKQNIRSTAENVPQVSAKVSPKSSQSNLNAYLSKRRNTTGSISFNKAVDTKTNLAGNALKLTAAANAFNSLGSKVSGDSIFQTVEDSDILATTQLLRANESLVNSYDQHDWRPLDVAIMLNSALMVELLLHHGAEESLKIQPEESRYRNVCHQLAMLSDQNADESAKTSSPNKLMPAEVQFLRFSPSSNRQHRFRRPGKCQQQQQQQQSSQRRTSTLIQMKENYEQADVPDSPTDAHLMVTGSDHVTVTFNEPLRSNRAVVTKYRIEWSTDEDFTDASSDTVKSCSLREYTIRNLPARQRCYVRVSAGNMRGFGPARAANPPYCMPSNWRDFSKTSRNNVWDLRFEEILTKIFNEREGSALNRAWDGNELSGVSYGRNSRRSYGNLRKNLRQLFQVYPRPAKSMTRGLYLVSVMLSGDRILVTNDDVLPMIEVDDNYGQNLLPDFQWFMKLTFVWDDLKSLRSNWERCSSATSFYLRMKLVQAAIELQMLQETNNLGRLHHAYIRDDDGNVAFVLINNLSSETRPNTYPSSLKWTSMVKFLETMKESPSSARDSCLQQIAEKLPEMIDFYHASVRCLDSGLYVAYLKIRNSVDSIRVMVNKHMPGTLPCTKVRSVANVSSEEWEWLHNSHDTTILDDEASANSLNLFKMQFRNAAKELFAMLDLPEMHFSNSRIYGSQVVEVRDDLSLIILMSTADEVNILSKPSSHCLASFVYLPVYIFEVLQHLSNNYRFICQYSRVSICLDFELINAQQNLREAFSISELDEARGRLNHLLSCQQDLDDIWRLSRWMVHVINCAKDKTYSGISLRPFQQATMLSEHKVASSASLPCEFDSRKCFIPENESGLSDTGDTEVDLTLYRPFLTSNAHVPIKLRLHKTTTLREIQRLILRQQHDTFFKQSSSFDFVWKRSSECENILEEDLTASDLQTRLLHFGGQLYLRSNSSSSLNVLQAKNEMSFLFSSTSDTDCKELESDRSSTA